MRAKLAKKQGGGAFRAVFCAATAFAALAATATTYYAKPDGDDTKDGLSWENAVTITNGFAKVNSKNKAGLELVLGRGTYKLPAGIGCTGGNTEANRVVVRGETGDPGDVVLDAQAKARCLRLNKYITVSGLTVSNGVTSTSYPAGGIRFAGASVENGDTYEIVVSNCVVTCCRNGFTADDARNGAAVGLYGHNLLVDSVIKGNTADWRGAGVLLVANTGTTKGLPKIKGCRIEGNMSAKGGAGIYVADYYNAKTKTYAASSASSDVAEIEDCTIVDNEANGEGGGGLYCLDDIDVRLTRCVVSNNTAATGGGGGVRQQKGVLRLEDCTFAKNATSGNAGAVDLVPSADLELRAANTLFRENTAAGGSGAVRAYQKARAFFDGCRFEGNSAEGDDSNGGGVYLSGQATDKYGYCSVSNCVFASNTCNGRGGALAGTWSQWFHGAIANCTFTNNQSRIQGGALCIREVANSTDAENTSPAVIRNCLFAFNGTTATTAESNGGGVYLCTNADMVMENCTIVSNNVPAYGTANVSGGIHHRWGATLKNCIVAFNTVGGAPESDSGWCVNQSKYYVNCCSTSAQSRFKQEYGSFAADPKFADAAHGDFTLRPSSPCRDVGAAADWMTDATDLAGNARILGAAPDIGCFEYRPSAGLIILLR